MQLAIISGQPLTGPGGLESWHPRDVDTLTVHYRDTIAEQNMQAARAAAQQMMGA